MELSMPMHHQKNIDFWFKVFQSLAVFHYIIIISVIIIIA